MTKKRRVFVLVDDDQVPLSPVDVAAAVSRDGFREAAENFGYSETTLRGFLAKNGFVGRQVTQFERTAPEGDREATPEEDARHRALAEQGLSIGG